MNKDTLLSSLVSLSVLQAESVFFDRFAQLIASDVSLLRAIEIAATEITDQGLHKTILEIKLWLEQGESIADAFRRYPNYFSKFTIAIIDSGEREGKLDDNLFRLAESLRREINNRKTFQQDNNGLVAPLTPGQNIQLNETVIATIATQLSTSIINTIEKIIENKYQPHDIAKNARPRLCPTCRKKIKSRTNNKRIKSTVK